jgi:hypothetical protein
MMHRLRWISGYVCLAVGLLLIIPVMGHAIQATATVDSTHPEPGESITLTVSVDEDAEVDVSVIKDFQVTSRGTRSSIQIVNTRMSKSMDYTFLLTPRKTGGSLTIPALPVKGDNGAQTETDPITVTVTAGADTQGPNDTPDLFVTGEVSNPEPYVGEPVVYTFKLFAGVPLSNARFQKPEFTGFTAEKASDEKNVQQNYKGRAYNVTTLQYLLIPIESGKRTIEPAALQCDLVKRSTRSRRSSPFNSFFMNDPFFGGGDAETRVFQTDPVSVTIRPLPADTGSPAFSGLVGEFHIQAAVDKREIGVGESANISLTVDGTGNLMDAAAPAMPTLNAFKVYPDQPQTDVSPGPKGYTGKKVFRYALVAVTAGTYDLPTFEIRVFNTAKGAYETLSASLPAIHVAGQTPTQAVTPTPSNQGTAAAPSAPPASSTLPKIQKKAVTVTGEDILPLKTGLSTLDSHGPLTPFSFIIYLLLPVLPFLGCRLWLTRSRKRVTPARQMAVKARDALKQASRCDTDEAFAASLYQALIYAVGAKSGTVGAFFTHAEAMERLEKSNVSESFRKEVLERFSQVETIRYSGRPITKEDRGRLETETRKTIGRLVK